MREVPKQVKKHGKVVRFFQIYEMYRRVSNQFESILRRAGIVGLLKGIVMLLWTMQCFIRQPHGDSSPTTGSDAVEIWGTVAHVAHKSLYATIRRRGKD